MIADEFVTGFVPIILKRTLFCCSSANSADTMPVRPARSKVADSQSTIRPELRRIMGERGNMWAARLYHRDLSARAGLCFLPRKTMNTMPVTIAASSNNSQPSRGKVQTLVIRPAVLS